MRNNFRGEKEWADCGMKITGANDEACKYYDAAVSQIMSWGYEDAYGKMPEVVKKLEELGSECVLIKALMLGSSLLNGKTIYDDDEVKKTVEEFLKLADKQKDILTKREKRHVAAIKYYSEGNVDEAFVEWERIMTDHPTDLHAMFLYFFALFSVGAAKEMMDLSNRAAPYFNKDVPLHEYVKSMQAFTYEEAGHYDAAEKIAMQNIENYPHDPFSYHAMSHVFEMTRRLDEGRDFMEKHFDRYEKGLVIACHNIWHNSLFYVENCQYDQAVEVYDSKLKNYLTPDNFLAYSDASSLFYRLKMAGYDVGKDRLKDLSALTDKFAGEMVRPFHASHILLAALYDEDAKNVDITRNLVKSCVEGKGFHNVLTSKVGNSLMDGIVKFHEQSYDEATDIFRPIRHHLYKIGGSHAQRDVYEQIICHAALNSTTPHNQNFARQLMAERQAMMASPLTEKMAAQLLAFHCANE